MKKILTLIPILILILPIVHSKASPITIKEAIERISAENAGESRGTYLMNMADQGAAIAVLQLFNGQFAKDVQLDVKEDELKQNVIIFGGPCANKYWTKFSDETCEGWSYAPGQSIVKVVENNGKIAVLIAGTDLKDTWEIARLLMQYKSREEFNKNSYLHTSSAKRFNNMDVKCKDNQCLEVPFNVKFVFKKNRNDYALTLRDVNESSNIISFDLNDKPYILELGESLTENGIGVMPFKIDYHPILAIPRGVYFHFTDSMENVAQWSGPNYINRGQCAEYLNGGIREIVNLDGNENAFDILLYNVDDNQKAEIRINGKTYKNKGVGDTLDTIRGYKVTLKEFYTSNPLPGSYISQVTLCFE